MRSPILPSALILASLSLAACQDAPTAPGQLAEGQLSPAASMSAAACENVRGEAHLVFTGPFTNEGPITGDLEGTLFGTVTDLDAKGSEGQGAIHTLLVHTIQTADGAIHTEDAGVLSPIAPPLYRVNIRYTVVGGTGLYEDASGFLRVHGVADFGLGTLELTYHGRICTAAGGT